MLRNERQLPQGGSQESDGSRVGPAGRLTVVRRPERRESKGS